MVGQPSYIKDFGGTGEIIILLHGFLSSSKYWKKLQPELSAEGFRVITIDLLGFGRAPKPSVSEYSYDDHLLHIQAAIKEFSLEEPFTLVGHSMGGLLAARYANKYPVVLKSLILLHPPLYKTRDEVTRTLRGTNRIYSYFLYSPFRRIGWILVRPFTSFHLGRHNRFSRDKSLRNVIESAEILQDLELLRVKTLLLVGLKDRPQYASNIKNFKANKLVTVIKEDVDHHSPIRETKLVKGVIVDFIKANVLRA